MPLRPRRWSPPSPPPTAGLDTAPWAGSQGDVAVLALWEILALGAQHGQVPDQHRAGESGVDDVVDITALGRLVGIGKALGVVLDELGPPRLRVGGLLELAPVDDLHRALRAHHRQLGG